MSVVVDANALIVLALDRRRAVAVERLLSSWEDAGEDLHAPALLPYEVANAFARSVAAGHLGVEEVATGWQRIAAVPVALHQLAEELSAVVAVTQQLQRKSAYDAAYVVLAQRLSAELWTLDGPLARNAADSGLPVRLIETD